jgi:Protein of unknown function (DUF2914)
MTMSFKQKIANFIDTHERRLEIGFFLGGFVFDVLTLSSVDDPFSLIQQVVYLIIIAVLLIWEFKVQALQIPVVGFKSKIWQYRSLILHFFLGSLLSIYSLFFIKSSSLFASFAFILGLLAIMVLNEMSFVQKGKLYFKVALFVLCLFSFFSLIVPTLLGFVGWIPFLLSLGLTGIVIWGLVKNLQKSIQDKKLLFQTLTGPGLAVLSFFTLFYFMGWVPPVPLSIKDIGIYHDVTVVEGNYQLKYEREWWKFWQKGAQDFKALNGDKIVVFASITAPGRFDDQIIFHWSLYNKKKGWQTQDRIPITIKGGRQKGFRGYGIKQNFTSGEWRIQVETTNGREIGRIYFDVVKSEEPAPFEHQFRTDIF